MGKIKRGLKAIRKRIPSYSYWKNGKKIHVPQHLRTYYVKAKGAARRAASKAKQHKTKVVFGAVILPVSITAVKFTKEMKKRGISRSDSIKAAKRYTRRYGKRAYAKRILRMVKERGEGESFFDEYARWVEEWKGE